MARRERLTLGIDIDGTVTEPNCFIPYLNEAFGKNLTFDDILQYELHPLYEVSEEEMEKWFAAHSSRIYASSPLQPGARDVLRTLAREHVLIYISARTESEYDTTFTWFKKHDVPYDAIHLIGTHRKIEKAREQQVQLFFEDKYDNACDLCEELSIPVILFDTPYNQGPLPDQVYRIHSWQEVPAVVEKTRNLVESTS